MSTHNTDLRRHADRGGILPIVLVATVVFTITVGAVANLVTAGLRYGHVVEDRADRLAAADGGLRYGVERLRNFEDLCSTQLGSSGGYTTIFPPSINGASTTVECRRVGNELSDMQGFGAVITGANVPPGQDILKVSGSGGATTGNEKRFRGPVYVGNVHRLDLQALLIIQDGDLFHTAPDCTVPVVIPEIPGTLRFEPDFIRGPECKTNTWNELFRTPTRKIPTPSALATPAPFDDVIFPGCRVFYPGKYTGALPLAGHNYFASGDYYFEDVPLELAHESVTFGFPSGSGDIARVAHPECENAMIFDQNTSGERGGATIWMGGSSHILVDTQAELEIFRRQQGELYLSLFAVRDNGAGFIPSDRAYGTSTSIDWLLETKSGNTNDIAVHGVIWAPYSKIRLGNVTNAAVGQLVGGLAVGELDIQASNSANEFAIGVEGTPLQTHFELTATATKDGKSTSIRAIVEFQPDTRALAINSWRVL